MLNYDNYAITLGRAVDVFRRGRDAVPEQKVALRALAGLSRLAEVVVEVGTGELRVGGGVVAPALPGVAVLLAQLEGHDVAEIRIRQATSPASLLELLRGLAEPLGARRPAVDLAARLRAAGVHDVEVRLVRPPPAPLASAVSIRELRVAPTRSPTAVRPIPEPRDSRALLPRCSWFRRW